MSRLMRVSFKLLDLLVIFMMVFGSPLSALAAPSETGATITSDAADYPPGATVTLTGAGWLPGESVHIFVNDDASQSWSHNSAPDPVADTNGAFTYQFILPNWFVANYSVTAGPGSLGSGTATTTFTDLSVGTYDQCSNDDGDGYAGGGDTGCRWINGNLQSNNSTYFEGDATVQRVWLTGFVPGSTHTLTLQYGTTKGGKHAYDFLTTWDWSEDWILEADRCQAITGCVGLAESKLDIPQDPNVPDSFEPSAPGDRQFTMRGGTLNSATTPVLESGSYAGDSETILTINFTVASNGSMCPTTGSEAGTCGVALWFGAHVSAQANWGLGQGAGSISGSPYHVALYRVDGASVGQRDNQMQANVVTAVPNGTIIIVKDAIPNDAQDFSFNLNNNGTISQNFSLDDDADITLPNSQTFSVPPGTWTASELGLPISGWTFTSLVCSDPTNNTTVSGAVATISLASNETVTCTFTNTKQQNQNLTVSKTAVPSFGRTYTWGISKSVDKTQVNIADGGSATFNYTVSVTHDNGTDSGFAVSGVITVTNPNGFDIAGVNISDAIDNSGSCTVTNGTNVTVPANNSITRNYSCTFTSNPGSGTNTATATWDSSAYFTTAGSANGTAGYNFANATPTVSNGTVTVTDTLGGNLGTVSYTDPSPKEFTYSKTFSGVGGTCKTYDNTATITETGQQASKSVKVCVGKDLTVSKTAAGTFDRAYTWKISKDVDQTRVNIAEGGSATFNYTVVAEQTGISESGWTVSGKITLTNPNDWQDITLTSLTDTVSNGGLCTVDPGPYTVQAGKTLDVNYSCSYAQAPSSFSGTNTATATWDAATYFTPSSSSTGLASFTMTQAGASNKTVHVTDSYNGNLGPLTATDSGAFAKGTFQYSRTESGVAGTCTDYDNTATITETNQSESQTVTVCVGKDLTISKTAAGTFNRTYLWDISKDVNQSNVKIADGGSYTFHYTVDVNQTGVTDAGWAVSGKITLTNPNDWQAITLTSLSDVVDNGGTCTLDAGPYMVPVSGSLDVNYTCAYASAPGSYSGKNTATAEWDKDAAFTPSGSASGSANFTLAQGGSTNKTINVTDSYAGDLGTVTATDSAPFAKATFSYDRTESGVAGKCTQYDNTATITETGKSASATATLCVGADLTVTKTAAGTFDRSYLWDIKKNADKISVNIAAGGTATFKYSVDVTQTGVSDGGWTLSGKITIANPNDWQDVTLTGLTDSVDNGGSCNVAPGPYIVPKGGSLDVNYTCSYGSAPSSYSGTNTANANWDKAASFTPSGSASGSAPFTLGQLGTTNKTVTVTDTLGGTLGTVTASDGTPFASKSFTYNKDFTGVGGTCKDYDNTATITETGQSASKTVTVCVGLDLTVSKTVTPSFTRTYAWGINKNVDKTTVNIADGGTATFNYTVDVTHDNGTESNWKLTGTITVTNPNDWEAITVTEINDDFTDVFTGKASCTVDKSAGLTIPASGSAQYPYVCTYTSAPGKRQDNNSALIRWNGGSTPNQYARSLVPFDFDKVNPTIVDGSVNVTDTLGGNLGTVSYTDPSPKSFTYPYDFKGDPGGTCTNHDNTATFTTNSTGTTASASQTVKVCVGLDLTVSKTAAGTFDRAYQWKISKSVDQTLVKIAEGGSATFHYTVLVEQTGMSDSGWTLSGKITVSNPNDWEAITVNVADLVDNGGSCTVTGGTGVSIPASGSKNFDYTCSYASKPASYSGTNTATATWDKAAAFTPTDSASGSANFTLTQLGSANKTVHITDSYAGDLGTVTASDTVPFATASFNYDRPESGVAGKCTQYNNTATITETNQSASASTTLCVAKDLTVSKTATSTFTRTYAWDISKSVDQTLVRQNGGNVTFNYTVVVKETGFADSNWKVTGTITVTNPNDWESITVNVADSVDNGGTCTVTGGTGVSIPASGSKSFNYSCTWATAPSSAAGVNTATATWDKAAAFTPNDSASGIAGFNFTTPTTAVNKTVTVTDTFNGSTNTLGTVTAVDATPYTTRTFTYARTVPVPVAGCKDYPNTAKIVETGQTASAKVTVCRPSLVTNSQLCTVPNDQWRLVFTPDVNQSNGYKLNATNPGQTFYNVFYTGAGNEDITITLPYPYVTQGAVPIHVYSNVGVTTTGGITCLTPSGELANQTDQVTLSNYTPQSFGSTYQVTVHVPALSGGFAYINIHLDYGLKGSTGYLKGGPSGNDAVDKINTSIVRVPDLQTYAFSDTAGGSYTVSTTNVFKKNPGIGGKGNKTLTDDPVPANTKVVITDANKKVVATVYTDEDGWYMWSYKYTGKATTFNITMSGITKSITLKANGYVEVNFTLP